MELLIALAVIAAVVFLVSRLKPGGPGDAPFAEARDDYDAVPYDVEASEPPPVVTTGSAPDGWVSAGLLAAPEATVVQGLLRSNGVEAVLVAAAPHMRGSAEYGAPAPSYRVYVAPEDAEQAKALLG